MHQNGMALDTHIVSGVADGRADGDFDGVSRIRQANGFNGVDKNLLSGVGFTQRFIILATHKTDVPCSSAGTTPANSVVPDSTVLVQSTLFSQSDKVETVK